MKAAERHELKENDLAKALASARLFLEEKGKFLGLVAVGVLALIAVIGFASSTRAAQVEQAWRKKSELTYANPTEGKESLRKLSVLIGETSDASFVQAALLEQGTQALRLAHQSEAPPDAELNDIARSAFEQLLSRGRGNLFAQAAAHSGLATVAENDFAIDQNPKHRDEAERHLKDITSNASLATTPFHSLAADRLARLDSTFEVVRFAATPPPPPVTPEPVVAAPPPAPAPEKVEAPSEPGVEPTENRKFMKVRMGEDGTIEVVDDDE